MTDLIRLEEWFHGQCDGTWEHQYGVRVETLDNPGWSVEIDLRGTPLHGETLAAIEIDRTPVDWIRVRLEDDEFKGFGGPRNLGEIIRIFLRWADLRGAEE